MAEGTINLGDKFALWWWKVWLDSKLRPRCTCKDKWEKKPLWRLKSPWLRRHCAGWLSCSATTSHLFWPCTFYSWFIWMLCSWILCTHGTVHLDSLLPFLVAFNVLIRTNKQSSKSKIWVPIRQGWNFVPFCWLSVALRLLNRAWIPTLCLGSEPL